MANKLIKFSKNILDRFSNPQNAGVIVNPDGVGHISDPSHGIDLELYIKIQNSIITDAKFKAFGCSATIATISMVSQMLEGKNIDEALAISEDEISTALDGLPPSKMHCARLGRELIESAIEDFHKKGE